MGSLLVVLRIGHQLALRLSYQELQFSPFFGIHPSSVPPVSVRSWLQHSHSLWLVGGHSHIIVRLLLCILGSGAKSFHENSRWSVWKDNRHPNTWVQDWMFRANFVSLFLHEHNEQRLIYACFRIMPSPAGHRAIPRHHLEPHTFVFDSQELHIATNFVIFANIACELGPVLQIDFDFGWRNVVISSDDIGQSSDCIFVAHLQCKDFMCRNILHHNWNILSCFIALMCYLVCFIINSHTPAHPFHQVLGGQGARGGQHGWGNW